MLNIKITENSTTADIARYLESAKNDSELKSLISEIRKEGKEVLGSEFNIRLDETNISRDFRRRVRVTLA